MLLLGSQNSPNKQTKRKKITFWSNPKLLVIYYKHEQNKIRQLVFFMPNKQYNFLNGSQDLFDKM